MTMIKCVTDEDYEKFAIFFLRNRHSFADMYPLLEAIGSIYVMIDETNILLFSQNPEEVIGAVSYTYGTRERDFEDKHIIFVDCALIGKENQGSRLFVRYFQEMVKHIAKEHEDAKEVRFYAYRHHQYIHGLYKKFATVIEEREDCFGIQDVFSVEFDRLAHYLERFKEKKLEVIGDLPTQKSKFTVAP